MSSTNNSGVLQYKGSNFLKQRLILSVLSGKPVEINNIRSNCAEVGIQEYEVGLIRLLDKITNGTRVELNKSGTKLYFKPGLLDGGNFTFQCSSQRGIGYYLDCLLALGIFCKNPIIAKLIGATNSSDSPSVDEIKASAFPILKKFIIVDDGLEMKIVKRGLMPNCDGEVIFKCPVRRNLRSVQILKQGMVKRIRGVCFNCNLSPALANRTVESAKGVLLNFLPDVFIHTDQNSKGNCGKSPGFGIMLLAETTENITFSAELQSKTKEDVCDLVTPEELGNKIAFKLMDEIYRGGTMSSSFQWLMILYMALSQRNVSKCLTGSLSEYSIHFLRHLKDYFSVTFKIENPETEESGNQKVLLTCIGTGFSNITKRAI